MKIDKTTVIDFNSLTEFKKRTRGGRVNLAEVSVSYPKADNGKTLSFSFSADVINAMGNPISIKIYKKGIRIYFQSMQDKSGYILSHHSGSSRYQTRVTIDKLSIEPGDYDLTYLQNQDVYFIEER